MILQKFIPTITIINNIVDNCFDATVQSYMLNLLDNDFDYLDSIIKNNRTSITNNLDYLSNQKSMDMCIATIINYSLEEKFVLQNYLTVAALNKDFHIERLPMYPLESLPFNFFAYLESAFDKFNSQCQSNKVSVSASIFSLSLDNFDLQNI